MMMTPSCPAVWQAFWKITMCVLLQPFVWAARVAINSISSTTVSTCWWMNTWFERTPRVSKTCKECKACSNTAAAEPCTLTTWSISTEVATTPSSSSVNPFFEPEMQCEMAAAGSELNGLALLTGYAAVDGIQVSHPLAAPYNVTVNPLFQQISHGYKPAAVAPHHPAYPLGQGNNVMLVTKQDSNDAAVTTNSSANNKSNACQTRRTSSSSSCSTGCSRRSSITSSSISSSISMRSTANSSTRSCVTRRPSSSSSSSSSVGDFSVTSSRRPAAVTTTLASSLKAQPAVAVRSTSPLSLTAAQAIKSKQTALPKNFKATNTATTSTVRVNSSVPVSRSTCKPPAATKVKPPAAGPAASAATVTPHQPPAAAQAYVVAFGRRIAVPAGTRTTPCNTTGPHTGSNVSSSIRSTEGSASTRQGSRANGRSGPSPSNSSSSGLSRGSQCSLTGVRSRARVVAAAAPKAVTSSSAAAKATCAAAAAKAKGKEAHWRF